MDEFERLMGSEVKCDLLTLIHNNASVLPATPEELARRIGKSLAEVRAAMEDFVGLGVLKKVGESYWFTADADRIVQKIISAQVKSD